MYTKFQRALALACVGLLLLLYLSSLVLSLMHFEGSDRMFLASMMATVALPILLWIYLWLFQKVKARKEEARQMMDSISESAPENSEDQIDS